jgi:hypothetical protein
MTWDRGNTRIWKRAIPDLRLEAGVFVIISSDLSGSMQRPDVGAGDPVVMDYHPAGIDPQLVSRGGRDWSQLGAALRAIGEVVEPTWMEGTRRGTAGDDDIGQGYASFYTVNSQSRREIPAYVSRVHATAGMSYVVGQALADVGSEVELIWWGIGDRNWYNVVKDHQTVKESQMYYPLDMHFGGTGPWQPAAFALKQFKESPAPGKLYVTITDAAWSDVKTDENTQKYVAAVKEMSNSGVTTLLLVVGQEMSGTIKALKENKELDNYRREDGSYMTIDDFILGHDYAAAGSTVEALMEAVPDLIIELQRDLVEKALRNTGIT